MAKAIRPFGSSRSIAHIQISYLIGERGNTHEAPAAREGLPGHMPMGAGFFEKARADSETWDLGLATNEAKLLELSPPAAYVVIGQLAKLRFPFPFTLFNKGRGK